MGEGGLQGTTRSATATDDCERLTPGEPDLTLPPVAGWAGGNTPPLKS
jgi:hypothetical protein